MDAKTCPEAFHMAFRCLLQPTYSVMYPRVTMLNLHPGISLVVPLDLDSRSVALLVRVTIFLARVIAVGTHGLTRFIATSETYEDSG